MLVDNHEFEGTIHSIGDLPQAPVGATSGNAGAGLQFQVNYGAGVPVAVQDVVTSVTSYLSAHYSNPVTIVLDINWTNLGSNILGQSQSTFYFANSYSSIPQNLAATATSADDAATAAAVAAANPVSNSEWLVTQAQLKAWGLGGFSSADATITFSSGFPFDFDNSDGVTAGTYDFYGVAAHEITEVMGRVLLQGSATSNGHPLYTVADLFKYSAAATHVYGPGTTPGYFSVDNGTTALASYNTNANGDFGDWASANGFADAVRAFSISGTVEPVTDTDLRTLDVIGWTRVETPSVVLDLAGPSTDRAGDFYEVAGHDNGTGMVTLAGPGNTHLSDTGSTRFTQLKVAIADGQLAAGDQLSYGPAVINLSAASGTTARFSMGGATFSYKLTNDGTTTSVVFTSINPSTLSPDSAPLAAFQTLLGQLAYNNASDTPADGSARAFSVSANDGYGWSAPATFGVSIHATNDAPTGGVTVTGLAAIGQVLTADTSKLADPDGLGAFSYQWSVGGTPVGGATSSTYTVQFADINLPVTVTVSYTDAGGTSEGVVSAATAPVTAGTPNNDSITGTSGDDVLNGLAGNDIITALGGNDVLIGGAGLDQLDGGDGSDIYMVAAATDHGAAEFADTGVSGTDEVRFTATTGTLKMFAGDTGIETLVLGTGTGATADRSGTSSTSINASAAPNGLLLEGNAGNNLLTGTAFADTLDGGAGRDTMVGGQGNDIYIVDAPSEVVTEASGAGTDTVLASVSFVLGTNVDNLTLTGAAAINGTGNLLANVITGNGAANVIDGKAGIDVLDGGDGSDIYIAGLATDHPVAEFADSGASGVDEVRFASTKASTLTIFAGDTGIERVVIGTGTGPAALATGTAALGIDATAAPNALTLVGNAGANTIKGTAYNDTIVGGPGNDLLTGGAGADVFVFASAPSARSNKDTITDFTPGTDVLQFASAVFPGAGPAGALDPNAFWSGAGVVAAHDADDRFIYDTTTGSLYYDADGVGGLAPVIVAVLGTLTHPALTAGDIAIG